MRRRYRLFGMMVMVILGTGTLASAQYQVQPMRLAWTALAGETIRTQVRLINQSPQAARATVTVIDLVQNAKGQWMPLEPDTEVSSKPETPGRASCREWIVLKRSPLSPITLSAGPLKDGTAPLATLPITITVPATASGSYLAALKVAFSSVGRRVATAINFDYVIPVVLDVLPAAIDPIGTPVDDLVTDLTLSPASLIYQVRPGQTIPATLTLSNHHPHQAYNATLTPDQILCDTNGQSYRSWVKAWPTGAIVLPPQRVLSLELQVVVPEHVQGHFDTTLILILAPAERHGLVLEYACEIPLHLEVTEKASVEPNQPLHPASLRIINPRPLEIQSTPQACEAHGTLALYTQRPLHIQGPPPGNPWQCSADPNVISSNPLTALRIQGPPSASQSAPDAVPIVLHISPASD